MNQSPQPPEQRLWSTARLMLLIATFGAIVGVLGRNLLAPSQAIPPIPALTPPEHIPLPGWQITTSKTQAPPAAEATLTWHLKQSYHYQRSQQALVASLYYVSGPGEVGDTRQFLQTVLPNTATTLKQRRHPSLGSYNLFVNRNQYHLVACLMPNGRSSADHTTYRQNSLQDAMNLTALQGWMLGQRPFLDKRCLWTHMVFQRTGNRQQTDIQALEQAWVAWVQGWQPHIPKI